MFARSALVSTRHSNEPTNVEPSFNELRVIGKGLFNTRVSPCRFLCTRHAGAATKRSTTCGPESKGPRAPRRSLGGFSRLRTRRGTCRIRTQSSLGGRRWSSTGTGGALSTTWAWGALWAVFSVLGVGGLSTFGNSPLARTSCAEESGLMSRGALHKEA
jgi:hypothetical protein